MRRITRILGPLEALSKVEPICSVGGRAQNHPPKVAGSMGEDVTQQPAAQSAATMRRENVESTEAARRFVLAINAADRQQFRAERQAKESLARLIEPIAAVFPLLA